jgi:cytochrome c-type biogenesis protein CcmF
MIGSIIIYIAFGGALLSLIMYYLSFSKREFKYIRIARTSYHLSVIGTMVASAILMYLIVTHQFQYTYVWSYSSM